MRILVIIHEYPPVGGGGGPIARDLSREWVKAGHEVRVVTSLFSDLPSFEVQDGIEIVRLKSGRKEAFRAKLGAMFGYVFAALKYCLSEGKRYHPDIIHAHFAVPCGPVAMVAASVMHVPYVITAHLGDIPGASPEKTGNWFKFVYPFTPPIWQRAARVVAVSEYSRSMALKSYQVPIDVIPNGIDYQIIHNINIEKHSNPEIIFAGRFVAQKNLEQIVNTLAEVQELSWHCTLIGEGEEKQKIVSLISDKGLAERFSFTGWIPPEEVIKLFYHSDILFLPSLTEGLPVVGIQAMAAGLALLLSDAGGNPEIIQTGINGFVNKPQDREGFVRDLRKLLSDEGLLFEMRQKSLQLAKSFDIQVTAADYIALFEEVTNKK